MNVPTLHATAVAPKVAPSMVRHLSPRLLNATEAAAYLGYASTDVLRHLPIQPIRLTASGAGSASRWDLRALDALLDERSGIAGPDRPQADDYDSPEADLAAWRMKRGR